MANTMTVLLKHETDIIRAKRALSRGKGGRRDPRDFDPDDFSSYRNVYG